MSKIREPFKCNLHKNVLTADFCREHKHLFPAGYTDAAPMAEISIESAKTLDISLAMLPFDYVVEAEAYGAEITGYNDIFGLRAKGKRLNSAEELPELPPMDFTGGRLTEIIKAVSLIDKAGYTPCLNITGLFSLLEILLPIEKVFSAWRKRQKVLLEFVAGYEKSLIEFITLALNAGAKVIPTVTLTGLAILGRKNGQQIAKELVLPFYYEISRIPNSGIIHVCGVSSDILTAADAAWLEIELETEKYYSEAIIEQALATQGIKFFGYGCLHHNRMTGKLTQLLPQRLIFSNNTTLTRRLPNPHIRHTDSEYTVTGYDANRVLHKEFSQH